MNWFCYQRSPIGIPVPVAFDERPDLKRSDARDIIKETIREIPEEMRDMTLAELAAKFHVE